jgi:hypothetical protein
MARHQCGQSLHHRFVEPRASEPFHALPFWRASLAQARSYRDQPWTAPGALLKLAQPIIGNLEATLIVLHCQIGWQLQFLDNQA